MSTHVSAAGDSKTSKASLSLSAKDDTVDINAADVETLKSLPGIGSVLAQRIHDMQPFDSIDDLKSVKGISANVFAQLRKRVSISGEGSSSNLTQIRCNFSVAAADEDDDSPVDIATATADELQERLGLKANVAQNVVSYRKGTPFQDVQDIMSVSGIKQGTFAKIRRFITVSVSGGAGRKSKEATGAAKPRPEKKSTGSGVLVVTPQLRTNRFSQR
jgi:competence ComEA-like helix-hairpin-helix protein